MTPSDTQAHDRILEAAAALFAERGYKATTTRAIAEHAQVNEVTVFRRFGNKLGVLTALAQSWESQMAGFAVTAMPRPTDTRATIEALARLEVEHASRFGAVAMRLAMDAAMVPEVAELLGTEPARNFDGMVGYLRERQAAGDLRDDVSPEVMTEMFFSVTSTLVLSRQVMGSGGAPYQMDIDEVVRQVVEILWSGIAAAGEGGSR